MFAAKRLIAATSLLFLAATIGVSPARAQEREQETQAKEAATLPQDEAAKPDKPVVRGAVDSIRMPTLDPDVAKYLPKGTITLPLRAKELGKDKPVQSLTVETASFDVGVRPPGFEDDQFPVHRLDTVLYSDAGVLQLLACKNFSPAVRDGFITIINVSKDYTEARLRDTAEDMKDEKRETEKNPGKLEKFDADVESNVQKRLPTLGKFRDSSLKEIETAFQKCQPVFSQTLKP